MDLPGQKILRSFMERILNAEKSEYGWGDYSDSTDSWLDSSASPLPEENRKDYRKLNEYGDYGDYNDHGWGDYAD